MNKFFVAVGAMLMGVNALAATQPLPEPVQQFEKQGIQIIKPFTAPGGVQGWLGKYQDTGVTIFLTPDNKHAISGYIYDAKGNNLSEKIINDEIYIPAGREMWKRLQAAPGLEEGSQSAACQVVVFADPFCPYCNQFWHQAQPWVKQQKISIKTQLVGVIRQDSALHAAAILGAKDPNKAWRDFENSNGKVKPPRLEQTPRPIFNQIQNNQRLMEELGANGTPAIYYLNKDRVLQQIVGMPDEQQMKNLVACQ
ncbi:thiol:disulfide interchange protein DsbG [Jejubacter calystegiae]|uniref:Thiol:disulfide interchange protein n=1 Tax=Jejubacter calystegiae TaxID=2579935 RepID=A0A4P8YJ19_9ENTR|nr:thiol:disulfide interchange protein DsbG [Jejubacter calystegiae]QCT19718.1 thiol:disulfide interchange protein DsbG [Jejubacter calystegiae]